MALSVMEINKCDPAWDRIVDEAKSSLIKEPLLSSLVHSSILHHRNLEQALSYRVAYKLSTAEIPEQMLREISDEAMRGDGEISSCARADLVAVTERDPACNSFIQPLLFFKGFQAIPERDPACNSFIQPLLFFKGFQAIQAYRIGHWLWKAGRKDMAYYFQSRISEVFNLDIHPAAVIGHGIMIDHAHSIVIGETAVVGNNVSMLHSVTLGGTGKQDDDRHPKIGDGVLIGAGAKVLGNIKVGHSSRIAAGSVVVLIGAGAKVLGNIKVGHSSRIAAGSVVLHDVPPCKTVAGVPAKIVGSAGCDQPSVSMDQLL